MRPFSMRAAVAPGLVLALLTLLASPGFGQAQEPVNVRIQRDKATRYVTSGAWTPQGLLLLDVAQNRLTRLAPAAGTSLEAWRLARFEDLEPFPPDSVPLKVASLDGTADLMVQVREAEGQGWARVRVNPSGAWTVQDSWGCPECSTSQWVALGPELVLAAGEIQGDGDEEDRWTQGLFWVSPDGAVLAHRLAEEDLAPYLMGLTWVAELGGRAYAIVPEPEPDAAGADPSPRYLEVVELSARQRGVRRLARLPAPVPDIGFPSRDEIQDTWGRLTGQPLPVALVGAGDHLVVVVLQGERLTLWTVDTASGGLHFVEEVPQAQAATVAGSEEHLALLRKGPMEGLGRQAIEGLLLYPVSRLDDRLAR